jgi:methyltransferase, FkbM family
LYPEKITPIQKGLGSEVEENTIHTNASGSAASSILGNQFTMSFVDKKVETIHITTIDSFVEENNLQSVDFIKADIEGFERYMLLGAKETLRRYAPKLAICTYHSLEDPHLLKQIILDANPNYIIVQKRKKLYAAVI